MFDDAVYLVNQCKHGITPTTFLNKLGTPVCKILPNYLSIMTTKAVNHCIKKSNTALNVGLKVMLLMIILPNFKLVNGSIGTIREIIYKHKSGPRQIPYQYHNCVIFNFKECTVDEESKWRDDLPSTYIPITPLTIRCEKRCCTVTSIPLRVCKALTIHKSQGMNVGPDNPFKIIVTYFAEKKERTNPGSELVTISINKQVTMESLKKLEVVIVITKEKNSMKCYRLKIFSQVRLLKII